MRALHPLLLAVLALPGRAAQQGGPGGAGVDREKTWPAPTKADWEKPCLVRWQRSYADALAVAQETGKPILICVNMDGEIASEHYAGIRYRRPETAALYEAYVCVIASVYRHTPRDYDEQGRRIPCPRFGSVTCGEHIAIEPGLFEQYFDGKRIAPRHIGVELDRKEMYDVYYAWDTDTIFDALREGIASRPPPVATVVRGDRSTVERVESRDEVDRTAVETAYLNGDRLVRRALLEAALAHAEVGQVDLIRLALSGGDPDLRRLAWRALVQTGDEGSIDLILEALRYPMETEDRDALIATLARIGEKSPRARTLALVHRGLALGSKTIDVEGWSKTLATEAPRVAGEGAPAARVEANAARVEVRPQDVGARLDLAASYLALAAEPGTTRKYARVLAEDARRLVLETHASAPEGWRGEAVLGSASRILGEADASLAHVEAAVAAMPAGTRDALAAETLAALAESRRGAIVKAVRQKVDWPQEWVADMDAAYDVLARHPLGTDAQVADHVDSLRWLGARARAESALAAGLARFPDSGLLHERLRGRLLAEKPLDAIDGLEATYEAMRTAPDAGPNIEWFAGYASLIAAECQRRAGHPTQAQGAYDRAVERFDRWIARNPDARDSADHYVALALAGRARLAYERGDDDVALVDVLASLARRPASAASGDGLNITPVDTARMLRPRLLASKRDDLAARLQAALDRLDPELLLLPRYERDLPAGPASGGRAPGPRREPSGG